LSGGDGPIDSISQLDDTMGLCFAKEAPAGTKEEIQKSHEIDGLLRLDRSQREREIRILLLGATIFLLRRPVALLFLRMNSAHRPLRPRN